MTTDFSDRALPENFPAKSDWASLLVPTFESDLFQSLTAYVTQQRLSETIFPSAVDVFNAFRFCSFADTKVVILGQDPYHGPGQAHGLSFSVPVDQKLPPSLKNIFKELKSDLGCECDRGNLTAWAQQGVLLLNTVLTVQSGNANSHRKQGWEEFTNTVIELLGQRNEPMVFILWGKPAAKKKPLIGTHHCILESPHPSPLSAHRGFFGSKPFSTTNNFLIEHDLDPINWLL